MRRFRWWIVAFIVTTALALFLFGRSLRRNHVNFTVAQVREEIDTHLPIGTARAAVEAYLDQQSIPHSYIRESPVRGNEYTEQALIRNSSHSLFIRGDIQLLFKFDDDDRLTQYSVKEIFTGP
jgi:hypothetical protein